MPTNKLIGSTNKRMGAIHSCEVCSDLATLRYQFYIPISILEDVPEDYLQWGASRSFHEDGIGSKSQRYRCEYHPIDLSALPSGILLIECFSREDGFRHL